MIETIKIRKCELVADHEQQTIMGAKGKALKVVRDNEFVYCFKHGVIYAAGGFKGLIEELKREALKPNDNWAWHYEEVFSKAL